MKVVDLIAARRANWLLLEQKCQQLSNRSWKSLGGREIAQFAALYRSACADLALADGYQLPPNTVEYLHRLVGQAYNQLYRARGFRWAAWGYSLLYSVPQALFRDGTLWLAFAVFWGVFIAAMLSAYVSPEVGEALVGREMLEGYEQMHGGPLGARAIDESSAMMGYYVMHNTSIGLQCFAGGLILGIGGLLITVSNAAYLGATFGHMATIEHREYFFEFVTAHGPFELTAIVLASAAGMKLGFSVIDTRGWRRGASLRQAAKESVPVACASIVLFVLAAVIEGFISPSGLPYVAKAGVALLSCLVMFGYFIILGLPRADLHAPIEED